MTLDIILFRVLNNLADKSEIFDALIIFFASYLQYILVIAFLLFLYRSAYSRRDKFYIFLITTISIIVVRLGIAEIIRFFYPRPRPFVTLEVHKLLSSGWFYSDTEWSFPSGHSLFFFAMAMAVFYYDKKWGIGFFIAAILVAMSRVIAGVHYPSDIVGGMVIGTLTTYIIMYVGEKKRMKI